MRILRAGLDLFRGATGGVEQAVYPGGEPPVAPRPDYVATDARGLVSQPATTQVRGDAPPAMAPTVTVGPRLSHVRVVRRRGRWRVELRVSGPARLSGRLERSRRGKRKAVFRLESRRFGAGPARMALGRLAYGRYRLRLLVDGKPAANARFTVRKHRRF